MFGITILGISLGEILLELIRTVLIVSFATAIHVHLAEVKAHEAGLVLIRADTNQTDEVKEAHNENNAAH